MTKILIADDHHLVRQGIRALLEKTGEFEVVGEAADGQEALSMVEQLSPDIVIMDIAMPRLNGTQATLRIRSISETTEVIILSMYSDPALVRQAITNGAKGYLLKSSVAEEMLLAIKAVKYGNYFLSSAISGIIHSKLINSHQLSEQKFPQGGLESLTPREIEVLQLIAEGYTNNGMAKTMNLSVKTVEKHRASLMTKLSIFDTAGLVRFAIKHGLIFLEE